MDQTFASLLKMLGGGPKLGFVLLAVAALMLALDYQNVFELQAAGAWVPVVAWFGLCLGAILLIASLGEWLLASARGNNTERAASQVLEDEAEHNLDALVDEERVYLNWLFRAGMRRFPCDYWDAGIEGLRNKQIIYVPEHSVGGVYVIRDSVWRHKDQLVAQWNWLPSAFKPPGLMTEAERQERNR